MKELLQKIDHTVDTNGMVIKYQNGMMPKQRKIDVNEYVNWKNYIKTQLQGYLITRGIQLQG